MTHIIIGKPPAPKQGATFADVKPGADFIPGGTARHMRLLVPLENDDNAVNLATLQTCCIADECPVEMLDVTPRDPEPDPAVTTYGELEPGIKGTYAFVGRDDIWLPSAHGHAPTRLRDGVRASHMPLCKLRRVPTSVVVHEEPGTHVRPHHRGHDAFVNGGPCSIADLQHIVQQGAALLAQQDAKPESDMAPSACPECGSSEVDEFEPVDGSPSWACSDCGRTTHPSTAEPGPAVTTYGELEPGEWAVDDCYGPSMRIEESTPGGCMVSTDGERFGSDRHSGRRVPASVVIHGEPGTHVDRDSEDWWSIRTGSNEPWVGLNKADLVSIIQQGAALLAQQDAKPEELPTARHPMEPSDDQVRADMDLVFTKPGSCEQQVLDSLDPREDYTDGEREHIRELRRKARELDEAKAAEDRSKPAPGYQVMPQGSCDWGARRAVVGEYWKTGLRTKAHAIAWTWTQHDAQQAGEGGES